MDDMAIEVRTETTQQYYIEDLDKALQITSIYTVLSESNNLVVRQGHSGNLATR